MISTAWLSRHINDPFVIAATKDGYRSRAAYKLLEIERKFRVIQNARIVLDIGCAPGSWMQIVRALSPKAVIIGVDLQIVDPIEGCILIHGDFTSNAIQSEIMKKIADNEAIDLILSDMAANSSGNTSVDHLRIIQLAEEVVNFALHCLAIDGTVVIKLLKGGQESTIYALLKSCFKKVSYIKPKASYNNSSEIYLVAQKRYF